MSTTTVGFWREINKYIVVPVENRNEETVNNKGEDTTREYNFARLLEYMKVV